MPPTALPATRGRLRSLFISDVHLGYRYARTERFLAFLEHVQPQRIYIAGDFIDGWRLQRRWYWQPVYAAILQRLLTLANDGVPIYYTPGNHDEFLKDYLSDQGRAFGLVQLSRQFVFEAADRRRYLVLHGDQFDQQLRGTWLRKFGTRAYDFLVWADHRWNGLLQGLRRNEYRFSSRLKKRCRTALQFIADYEYRLTDYAESQQCHGVICGHIHVPALRSIGGLLYCNSGDWVEHCTALSELEDGSLQLVDYSHPDEPLLLGHSSAAQAWRPSQLAARPPVSAVAAEL